MKHAAAMRDARKLPYPIRATCKKAMDLGELACEADGPVIQNRL